MAAGNMKSKCSIPSDVREGRAKWLSNVFVVDNASRVKCSEVLAELCGTFKGVSKRECGFVVRKCFPMARRIHSNHVYYYSGIRLLITAENLYPVPTEKAYEMQSQPGLPVVHKELACIPRSMHINRLELQPDAKEKATYNFSNGNFGSLELQWFRGMPVAVRSYESNIFDEARTVLSLPSRPCFPVLIGVCCDTKPYLIVTTFYDNASKGVYMSLQGLVGSHAITFVQWISIIMHIAEGLLLMHSCGFVHGDLKAENVILRKKTYNHVWIPVFLNLGKAKALDRTANSFEYEQDCNMFAGLMKMIIESDAMKNCSDVSDLQRVSQMIKVTFINRNLLELITYLKSIL